MCGIAGILHRDGRPVQYEALERVNRILAHRGPDGQGIRLEGSIGFAHRRLAIVDLSSRAAQPFVGSGGRFWLLFNGEIHNYLELRSELEGLGTSFDSDSDTEVVLKSFEHWGLESFRRFNGMWAIAIWDRVRRELVLSRDRFGIKPLYYSSRGSRFCFASEAKGILENFPEERVADEGEVFGYLVGGNPDGSGRTFFENVRSLPPASSLVVSEKSIGEPVTYWRLPEEPTHCEDPVDRLRSLLTDSVRLRLRSDAPLGICLSGGLDSSSVARLAIRERSAPLHCFSLRYEEYPHLDESAYVEMVAGDPEHYLVHWVTPRVDEFMSNLRRIVWHHDAPVPLRGRTAFWSLMAEAARWVKVVLIGEGGDELLAGYGRFILPYLFDRWTAEGWRSCFGRGGRRDLRQLIESMNSNLPRAALNLAYPFVRRHRLHSPNGPAGLIDPGFARGRRKVEAWKFHHTWLRKDVELPFRSHLNNALWTDFRYAGLPELLHQQDALGMAFSLECRPPMLDHRFVEFCFSLDFDQKLAGGRSKHILRQAMQGILPEPVLNRRDKKGLPTPFGAFLTAPQVLGEVRDLLLNGQLVSSGIFRRNSIRALTSRRRWRLRPWTTESLGILWRCLALELWYRQYQ